MGVGRWVGGVGGGGGRGGGGDRNQCEVMGELQWGWIPSCYTRSRCKCVKVNVGAVGFSDQRVDDGEWPVCVSMCV